MKRIIGFLIGIGLSVALVYGLRRLLNGPAPVAPTPPTELPKPPASPATMDASVESLGTPNVRIHRSGSRPSTITSSTNGSTTSASPTVVEEVVPTKVEAETVVETGSTESAPVELPTVQVAPPDTEQVDDFTPLNDIGPAFNQKLHAAGIKTIAALAALSPQEIEEKTGIPAERVERKKWREQAQAKLKGTEPEIS